MTKLGIVLLIFVALALWYALLGRRWLKNQSWAQGFFATIEPIEIALFKKSETILVARLLWFGGFIVTFYDTIAVFASSLDLTPITARVLSGVPEDMRGLIVSATISGIGLLIGWLRKRTSKPIEIVAAPTTPETIVAEAKVEIANAEAVATVVDAEAKAA